MIFNMVGGATVSTKIINVSSADLLPESPASNTIAIVSSIAVKRVYAQEIQPETPQTGDLWMIPSVVAGVVYVGGGEITISSSVYQYNGSEWVAVQAYQYRNGSWSAELYLIKGSSECEGVTGGWMAEGKKPTSSSSAGAQAPTVTKTENGIRLVEEANMYRSGVYYAKNKVDLSPYQTLRLTGKCARAYSTNTALCVLTELGTYTNDTIVASVQIVQATAMDLSIDVSGLTGAHVIAFKLMSNQSTDTDITINNLWLE